MKKVHHSIVHPPVRFIRRVHLTSSQTPFVLGLVLLGVGVFLLSFTVAVVGTDQQAASRERAQQRMAECLQLSNAMQATCINEQLRIISEVDGVRSALEVIEPIVASHTYMLAWTHEMSHTIGNFGYAYYRDEGATLEAAIGRALVECDGFGAFGCYHGVIETGLSQLAPHERTGVIRKACMEDALIQQTQYYVNQCLHWFGHGMALFTYQSLDETLQLCSDLNPENFMADEVQLCLSGVFHAGSVPGDTDDAFLEHINLVWRSDSPYYPCGDIEEKYRGHCYSHVPGRTRSLDHAVTFGACNDIPEADPVKKRDYVRRCYDTAANPLLTQIAQQVSLSEDERAQRIVDECRTYAAPDYVRYCYGGAVRYWVLFEPDLSNTKPFRVCEKVEEDAKPICYGSIGFGNNENYYSPELLQQYCANAEEEYRSYCERMYTTDYEDPFEGIYY